MQDEVKCNLTLIVNDEEPVFSVLGIVLAYVSVQHGLLAGLSHCGVFWHCVTVSGDFSGMTPWLLTITGSAVVSRGNVCAVCMCP